MSHDILSSCHYGQRPIQPSVILFQRNEEIAENIKWLSIVTTTITSATNATVTFVTSAHMPEFPTIRFWRTHARFAIWIFVARMWCCVYSVHVHSMRLMKRWTMFASFDLLATTIFRHIGTPQWHCEWMEFCMDVLYIRYRLGMHAWQNNIWRHLQKSSNGNGTN